MKNLHVDRRVRELNWVEPGEKAARNHDQFITDRLREYDRSEMTQIRLESDLSHYLHFGHISMRGLPSKLRKEKRLENQRVPFLKSL